MATCRLNLFRRTFTSARFDFVYISTRLRIHALPLPLYKHTHFIRVYISVFDIPEFVIRCVFLTRTTTFLLYIKPVRKKSIKKLN